MSEYRYYEFHAVDRPLDAEAQDALRAISTRARITATSFANHYDFGDLRANPATLVARWFDLHLQLTDGASRALAIRLPRRLLDRAAAAPYAAHGVLTLEEVGENLILWLAIEEFPAEDFDDGTSWLPALAPLRAALVEGDLRCLYLAWLLAVQTGNGADATLEPPRPPGLAALDGALAALVDFFGLDPDLVAAAAAGDPGPCLPTLGPDALTGFVRGLPAAEKDGLLVRFIQGDGATLANELRHRCRTALAAGAAPPLPAPRRRVGDLRQAAAGLAAVRARAAQERASGEKARLAHALAQATERRLDSLAARGEGVWVEIETLIETRRPAEYDRAVGLLADLAALAARGGTETAFHARVSALRARHTRLPGLLERLDRTLAPT